MGEVSEVTRLENWRRRKGFSYELLGEKLGVKAQSAWRYCLPRSHEDHRRPNAAPADVLREISDGEVDVGNYADLVVSGSTDEVAA